MFFVWQKKDRQINFVPKDWTFISQTFLLNDGITCLRLQISAESIALDLISGIKEYSSFALLKIITVNHINENVIDIFK